MCWCSLAVVGLVSSPDQKPMGHGQWAVDGPWPAVEESASPCSYDSLRSALYQYHIPSRPWRSRSGIYSTRNTRIHPNRQASLSSDSTRLDWISFLSHSNINRQDERRITSIAAAAARHGNDRSRAPSICCMARLPSALQHHCHGHGRLPTSSNRLWLSSFSGSTPQPTNVRVQTQCLYALPFDFVALPSISSSSTINNQSIHVTCQSFLVNTGVAEMLHLNMFPQIPTSR